MKTRFVKIIGYRVHQRSAEPCEHQHDFSDVTQWSDELMSDKEHICDKCGTSFTANGGSPTYNTDSGRPEPGDIFWADWYPETTFWDDHKGPHLVAILPNGGRWIIDSRASNCAKPEDRNHRCWCRHGSPEDGTIHVDTNGNWCGAGGGSIGYGTPGEPDYHGFLHNGEFISA